MLAKVGFLSEDDRRRAGTVAVAALHQAEEAGVRLPDDLLIWDLAGSFGPGQGAAEASVLGVPGPCDETGLAGILEAATSTEVRQTKGLHVTPSWLADELVLRTLGLPVGPEPAPVRRTTEFPTCGHHEDRGVVAGGRSGLSRSSEASSVCDPACGGGAFLMAGARALHAEGLSRRHVVESCLWGADIDPVGLATAEAALAVWSGSKPPPGRLVVGDTLSSGADLWGDRPRPGFDAVVGNPPFLSQLASATVRSADDRKAVQDRFGAAVRPYTDTAWLFLLAGADLVRPGGRLALLQPVSIVAARDAAGIREELLRRAVLRDLWVERERVFQAWVRVCCPILEMRETQTDGPKVALTACGDDDTTAGEAGSQTNGAPPEGPGTIEKRWGSWADRLADGLGVPRITLPATPTVGDLADVGAGFRGEYYGLVPLVREAIDGEGDGEADMADASSSLGQVGTTGGCSATGQAVTAMEIRPLVTAGVLDWGRSAWGERPVRFARKRWQRPVVDLSRAPETFRPTSAAGKASAWLARTARPKVIVANQTRVVEPVVDATGTWVPSVPALAVVPYEPADVWLLAAALASPTATAWLLRRAPGTALARHALKIAASDLGALPLPADRQAWEKAARAFQTFATADSERGRREGAPSADEGAESGEGSFNAYCRAISEAYGVPPDVEAWWRDRRSRYLRDP